MTKIFRAADRRFEERQGCVDGFRLASDAAITAGMATANGSPTLGAGSLNFDVRQLPPGELSSLYHFHRHAEELFMIVAGTATLRTPDGLHILQAGDIAFFETGAGGAHQLFNHSDAPCIYLDVRTFPGADIAEYPDSDRLLIVPSMECFNNSAATGYFEGEPPLSTIHKIFKQT
jgi:uncharacterized cupin superfamily protein